MRIGSRDQGDQGSGRLSAGKPRRAHHVPEGGQRARIVDREVQIELRIAAREQLSRVEQPQPHTIEEQSPLSAPANRLPDRCAPERLEPRAPTGDRQGNGSGIRHDGCGDCCIARFDRRDRFEAELLDERPGAGLEHRSQARGGAQRIATPAPGRQLASETVEGALIQIERPLGFQIGLGHELTAKSGQHHHFLWVSRRRSCGCDAESSRPRSSAATRERRSA
jgi:hypothetical protein